MAYTSGSRASAQAPDRQHWAIIEPSTDNRNQPTAAQRVLRPTSAGAAATLVARITGVRNKALFNNGLPVLQLWVKHASNKTITHSELFLNFQR
jgi:hypothetical protein